MIRSRSVRDRATNQSRSVPKFPARTGTGQCLKPELVCLRNRTRSRSLGRAGADLCHYTDSVCLTHRSRSVPGSGAGYCPFHEQGRSVRRIGAGLCHKPELVCFKHWRLSIPPTGAGLCNEAEPVRVTKRRPGMPLNLILAGCWLHETDPVRLSDTGAGLCHEPRPVCATIRTAKPEPGRGTDRSRAGPLRHGAQGGPFLRRTVLGGWQRHERTLSPCTASSRASAFTANSRASAFRPAGKLVPFTVRRGHSTPRKVRSLPWARSEGKSDDSDNPPPPPGSTARGPPRGEGGGDPSRRTAGRRRRGGGATATALWCG